MRQNGDERSAGDHFVPVFAHLNRDSLSVISFLWKRPAFAFTFMGPCSPSPLGIHPSCSLGPPASPLLHPPDDWRRFSAESYGTVDGVLRSGSESGGEASPLCPISVARSSLAAPGRCDGLSYPPRRPLLPSTYSPRRAVPGLGIGMGLSVQPSPPSPGGPVSRADYYARILCFDCLVCCLPPVN